MAGLRNRVAIITGGAKGIGESIATEFAAEGAAVAIADIDLDGARRVAARLEALGAKALAVGVDVADEAMVERMVESVVREFHAVHILVNNAGIYPRYKWDEITVEQWDRIQAVNVRGSFLCARAVFPYFKKQGFGKIVNISSVTFWLGYPRDLVHYITSKGAIIGFTRSLAKELGELNVQVNALTPGAIETEEEKKYATPEQVAAVVAVQALKRRVSPQDIARAAVFLASSDSDMITGQAINVDGGWAMH